MPTADLRALAERLDMLQVCWCDAAPLPEEYHCPVCDGTMRRLPAEAEVRAAIFEAGFRWLNIHIGPGSVDVRADDSCGQLAYAEAGEAAPNDLVLLALLRALEAARA